MFAGGALAGYVVWAEDADADAPPVAQPSVCVDAADGYAVEFPNGWHTDRSGRFACEFFDPKPFRVPLGTEFYGTGFEVHVSESPFDVTLRDLTDERFARTLSREPTTVAGRRAERLELEATGEGLFERGLRTYAYVVAAPGATLVVETIARPERLRARRSVVDRAARSLRLFEPAPADAAASGLPAPVEEKRAQILRAAEARDFDALRRLVDPNEFEYTFGGPVEGGPVEYWQMLERDTDEEPLEALAAILRMPYTLSSGHYVWPFAYDKTADTLTDYERELLAPLGEGGTFAGEGYLGWRAGIRPDGRWVFFLAGD